MRFIVSLASLSIFGVWLGLSCSKDKSDSPSTSTPAEGSAIVISGTLALQGEAVGLKLADVSVADLSVYCVTFKIPPVAGTGTVNADGSFSVSLEAYNQSVGCFITKGDDVLGNIVFEDSSSKNLNGDSKSSDRLAFSGNAKLGSIVLDLTTGKAAVDISQIETTIKETTVTATEAFDFTGSYEATSAGLDLPKGYSGVCTAAQANTEDCRGPLEGEKLWLKRIAGTDASDGSAKYAAMIWSSEEAFAACGSKLGVSYADAKAHGIDLSASGVAEGEFTWAAGFEDGWKDTANAVSKYSLQRMENVDDFNGYPGAKQYFSQYRTCTPDQPCDFQSGTPTVTPGFSFYAQTPETGCRDTTGKPVQPAETDYQNMTCEFETLTGGLSKNTCTKSGSFTCIHIGGMFDLSGNPISNAFAKYPDDYQVYADAGDACSAIATASDSEDKKLAQLRCYADYFHEHGRDAAETSCVRDVRTNWAAKTSAEFILGTEGPEKARSEHVFELFDYSSSTSGSLRGENREFRGIQVGNNWTDCEVRDSFSLTLKKFDDSNDILVEMIQSEANVSAKPACIAEFGAGRTSKFLFKLVKK